MIVGSLNEITILIRISYWRVGSLKESCLFFGVNFPISTSNLPFGFSLLSTCIELVEIADALEMNLVLKDKTDGTEYVIDYPEDKKGKSKRNMTEEEKKAAQKKSEATKARNAKKQAESQDN